MTKEEKNMLTIETIRSKDILELVSYQQPSYARVTILRGYYFYARCVNGELQEWIAGDSSEHSKQRYLEAIQFEEKLGSVRE